MYRLPGLILLDVGWWPSKEEFIRNIFFPFWLVSWRYWWEKGRKHIFLLGFVSYTIVYTSIIPSTLSRLSRSVSFSHQTILAIFFLSFFMSSALLAAASFAFTLSLSLLYPPSCQSLTLIDPIHFARTPPSSRFSRESTISLPSV